MATPVIQGKLQATFFSTANTAALTVGTSTANVAIPSGGAYQVRLVNVGSNVVYIAIGTDDTVAAVVPVAGTPSPGIPLLPNSERILSIGTATYIAAIAAATGNTLFITPGSGQ
jgi:hypothetical protein